MPLAIAALCLWTAPATAASPEAPPAVEDVQNPLTGGLLYYSTQSPLQRVRMPFLHQGPELPAAGHWAVGVSTIWSNTWIDSRRTVIDDEALWINPMVELGLTPRWAISLSVPVLYLSGGVMDAGIESFHRAFNLGNEGRGEMPRNQLYIATWQNGRLQALMDDSDAGFYPRAPLLSTRIGLAQGALPATVKITFSLPQLERRLPGVTSNTPDLAVSLATRYRWGGAWASTASVAYLRSRELEGYGLALQDWSFSGAANLAYRATARTLCVVQVLQETPAGRGTGSGLDAATTEVLVGVQHRLPSGLHVEAGLVENAFVTDNAADFGVFASMAAGF